MKNVFLTLVLLLAIVIGVKAQDTDRFSFATTIGIGISMSSPASTPITWQALGYYNFTDRWAVGVGTGLSFYEKTLIPLYGDIKFQIGRERKITPYLELAAGYSFAPSKDAVGGYFFNPSVGVQYPLTNKIKLRLAVGYESQDMKRLKKQADSYFAKEFEERLWHQSISIKLGIGF